MAVAATGFADAGSAEGTGQTADTVKTQNTGTTSDTVKTKKAVKTQKADKTKADKTKAVKTKAVKAEKAGAASDTVGVQASVASVDMTEAYVNNISVQTTAGGEAVWEDAGTNGVVRLSTVDNASQAVVNLPVAPLGLTYEALSAISSITYNVAETTNRTASLSVQVAVTPAGPYKSLNHIPADNVTGLIDATAGEWRDGTTTRTWAEVQNRYGNRPVNRMWVSLGTEDGNSSSSVDRVTVNGTDVFDFVYTGMAPPGDIGPEYKNPLTVQETEGGTATWEATPLTNGAVTLVTQGDPSQAVVNLPVLPLGVDFATLTDINNIKVAVAETTNKNLAVNVQVFDEAINGPYITLNRQLPDGFTGVDDATAGTWIDRSTLEENLTWSDLQTRYGNFGVNRIWVSLGTGQGASTSSVDYVRVNGKLFDFVVDNPAPVLAPDLPPTEPGTNDGSLTLGSDTVRPGDSITVAGDGFAPNSPVNLGVYPPQTDLGTVTTDEFGAFSTTVTIPEDATPGEYTLLAIGGLAQSDFTIAPRVLVSPLSVESADETTPPTDEPTDPPTTPPGTTPGLPVTGSNDGVLALLGFGALLAGVGALTAARRGHVGGRSSG